MEGKIRHLRKPLEYYFVFKEKQLLCENCFYPVFWGMTTLLSSLITLYYSPFYSDVYLVENISFRLSSQQVYSAGDRFFCNTPLIFCMCVHCFIRVWFLTCWRAPYKCYVGSLVGYYKCFVLVRIIFIRV